MLIRPLVTEVWYEACPPGFLMLPIAFPAVALTETINHSYAVPDGARPHDVAPAADGRNIRYTENRMTAINIRCLEGIDLESVPVENFDGKSL